MNWEAPTCVICLQDLSSNLAAINCGHIFHEDCISDCISNKTKNCPLCRERILPSKLLRIQFNLTLIIEPKKILGISEEESKDIDKLHNKLKELLKEIESNKQKLENIGYRLEVANNEMTLEKEKLKKCEEKSWGYEQNYMKYRDKSNELECEVEKFKELFKTTHKKMKEYEEKVVKLEGISKLLADIENTQSSATWANNARVTLPLEDQASQFYSALLITTATMKNNEKNWKELKNEHNHCSDEINKLKRLNAALRKENERIMRDNSNEQATECKVMLT